MIAKPEMEKQGIDWEGVRQRLAASQQALASTGELSPADAQRVLKERASRLAQVPEATPDASEILEVMTFTMGGEAFAIETRYVREVMKPSGITPLPDAPPFLVGVSNLRGEVTAVMDLRIFFSLEGSGERNTSQIVVLGLDRVEFGMQVDRIDEVVVLRVGEILEASSSITGASRDLLHGVTQEPRLILNGELLLADERLYVDDSD